MTLEEFEQQYREAIDGILNRLQTVALLANRVQSEAAEMGTSISHLNQLVENFIEQQSDQAPD